MRIICQAHWCVSPVTYFSLLKCLLFTSQPKTLNGLSSIHDKNGTIKTRPRHDKPRGQHLAAVCQRATFFIPVQTEMDIWKTSSVFQDAVRVIMLCCVSLCCFCAPLMTADCLVHAGFLLHGCSLVVSNHSRKICFLYRKMWPLYFPLFEPETII